MHLFQQKLIELFQAELPGEEAHKPMMPINRPLSSAALKEAIDAKESAVAVLIFEENGIQHCTLIQRPSYDGNHSGQVSFPGGKRESSDENLAFTAIRECWEEVGIQLSDDHLIGKLTSVYIPVSNFHVEPFLFYYPEKPAFKPDEREVESIFTITMNELLDDSNLDQIEVKINANLTLKNIPCFNISEKQIWGATALILNELKELLREKSSKI
jgi:8-oxo-dGTP pyrophosphatase MutT (NUDIX family)